LDHRNFSLKAINRTVAWLVTAALLLALGVSVSFWSFGQIQHADQARKATVQLMGGANDLLDALNEAQASQRLMAFTQEAADLQSFLTARRSVQVSFEKLLTSAPDGALHRQLSTLKPLIEQTFASAGLESNARDLASIRLGVGQFVQGQEAALVEEEAQFQLKMSGLYVIIIAATALTLTFALAAAYLIYRESQQRIKNMIHLETQHLLDLQWVTNDKLMQANTTLQVSEERLAVTLDSIGDAVIATDTGARVTLMNPIAEKLTGWTQTQASGLHIDEILQIVDKTSRQPVQVLIQDTLTNGTVHALSNHKVLISHTGGECDIAQSCAPIRDRDHQVVGAVLVIRNVTLENATQQALRDSAELVQTIVNTVADGIVTVRASDGVIQTLNPATERMFGYPEAELVGRRFLDLVPTYDGPHPQEAARVVEGRRHDGSTFPLEITVSEMQLDGRRFFTGLLRDITVRNRVSAELESARVMADKANLAKSDFLSSMSHELRSPLNAILGFAQLMDSGTPAPSPSQKASIDQILRGGWYLLELINEILDLATIESGKLSMLLEPTALHEVLLDCQSMMEPLAQQKSIRMTFGEFDGTACVLADRTRLKQVLVNLISNAIKYNRTGGTVDVACHVTAGERMRISVQDNGQGLTQDELAQLFQPFNRLGQEGGVEEGTGIGLVVCKRLVELMGGEIGAQSTLGSGSLFWFELDLATMPLPLLATPEASARPQDAEQRARPQRTVLYVEDNRANMELMEQLIARRPDMRLLTALDARIGIALARIHQPQLILMDINLPGISGLEALKLLRADPTTAHIPVLALSANAMPRDIERGLEAGFLRYLTKPIRVPEFMDALDYGLDIAPTAKLKTYIQGEIDHA
jgi:PAS domain S-box-containing protein